MLRSIRGEFDKFTAIDNMVLIGPFDSFGATGWHNQFLNLGQIEAAIYEHAAGVEAGSVRSTQRRIFSGLSGLNPEIIEHLFFFCGTIDDLNGEKKCQKSVMYAEKGPLRAGV